MFTSTKFSSMSTEEKIIFCTCANCDAPSHDAMDAQKIEKLFNSLIQHKNNVIRIDDLCGMAAKRKNELIKLFDSESVRVVACYPRAVKWLLEYAGIDTKVKIIEYYNLLDGGAAEYINSLTMGDEKADNVRQPPINISKAWIPWFPVLDFDRCNHCKQCMSFCLFKVYDTDKAGKVYVKHPENCKNDCPACARICPKIAIMFPKLDESPINGDVVDEKFESGGAPDALFKGIMGEDMYSALKERNKQNRIKLLKRKNVDKALEERKKCGCDDPKRLS